jgi:flagellar hook-associated protein 3 FlgL
MRVTFNMSYRNGVLDIQRAAEALQAAQREVSSGRRVQVPSDDPSAAAEVVGERARMREVDSYQGATDSVEARLRVADSVLSDVIGNLTTAQVKAAAAQVSFATPQQREALALELEGIRDAILSSANASFRGTFLFSGTQTTVMPFPQAGGTVQAYQGNSQAQQIDVSQSKAMDVTFDGFAVFGDVFADFDQLIAAVRAGNISGAGVNVQQGLQRLTEAFERATAAQSRVGGFLATIETHRSQLSETKRASDTRRSTLEDANLAEAITRMQQADAAHRAAVGAVGATSRLSLMDYLR